MRNEHDIVCGLYDYFDKLGYSKKNCYAEKKVLDSSSYNSNRIIDFVIMDRQYYKIIVEVKKSSFKNIESEKLKYEPAVRQAQSHAEIVGANYFVVTNGDEYLWFITDSSGRPQKIAPVLASEIKSDDFPVNKLLYGAFAECRDLLSKDSKSMNHTNDLLLIILTKVIYESTETQIVDKDINKESITILLEKYINLDDINVMLTLHNLTLKKCFYVLDSIKLINEPIENILNILMKTLKYSEYTFSQRIPHWLADFMSSLVIFDNDEVSYLDPCARTGELLISIKQKKTEIRTLLLCQTQRDYLTLTLIKLLLRDEQIDIRCMSYSQMIDSDQLIDKLPSPSVIITILPFGIKMSNEYIHYNYPIKFNNFEDYLIYLSLRLLGKNGRLIALVPNAFLSGVGWRKHFKNYLLEKYSLRAIIALPTGILSFSGIKMSIIIIDNSPPAEDVYFAKLCEIKIDNLSDDSAIKEIVQNFHEFHNKRDIKATDNNQKVVPATMLDVSLSAETYLFSHESYLHESFRSLQLKSLCKNVKKGGSVRLDKDGKEFVLGPAAIRQYIVDTAKYNFTNLENINGTKIYATKNQIVVNGIGTFLGVAALVTDDKPVLISQHVFILTPDLDIIYPEYLAIAINSKYVQSYFKASATGTVIPSISSKHLQNAQIPVPARDIQKRIIEEVRIRHKKLLEIQEKEQIAKRNFETLIDTLDVGEVSDEVAFSNNYKKV